MKAINVDGQMTAKDLLSLVDGYYKLEKPIGYTMGKTSATTGEISGIININTDVKILDGITKVITSLADDTSYYIENVWQDGDSLEVSAMDETSGGEGGGGGESDFSMATLHIVNSTGSSVRAYCPIVVDNDGATSAQTRLRTSEEEQDFTVILYGTNGAYLSFQDEGVFKYTISGDIESADQEYPDYWVTGDCTVTVTQVA